MEYFLCLERGLICLSNESKIVKKYYAGIEKQASKNISVYANIREIKSFYLVHGLTECFALGSVLKDFRCPIRGPRQMLLACFQVAHAANLFCMFS